MEIEIYSYPDVIPAEFIHSTTRRERSPVSRTSDANFSIRAADCGCSLIPDYHCLAIMKFDHTHFLFEDALKHVSYRAYYGLEICSSLYLVTHNNDTDENIPIELWNDLHIPFALQYIFPYTFSYDNKSYDIYKLFEESLDTIDLESIDPNTYFYYEILPESGLTEISYDCSPKKYTKTVSSKIIFDHVEQIFAPHVIRSKVNSQITFVEKLVKG